MRRRAETREGEKIQHEILKIKKEVKDEINNNLEIANFYKSNLINYSKNEVVKEIDLIKEEVKKELNLQFRNT